MVIAPPAIAWLGQFFVPLGGVLGSDQTALLFSTNAALVVALALLYAAGLRLTEDRWPMALVGALAAGSAPLVVNLSHFYLVEPIPILAVVWVLFVMVSARRWHISLTVVQLGAAVAFGLLTKLSTPAYVAVPAAVALVLSFLTTKARPRERWWSETKFLVSALLMVVLAYVAAAWYRVNFRFAWAHAELAATSTFWGTRASFASHLHYWLIQLRNAFLLPYVDLALAALLVASGLVLVGRRTKRPRVRVSRYHVLVLLGCLGVPAGALVLLADQVGTDPRFVAPTVPGMALGLVALLRMLDNARITGIVAVLLASQFGLMALQSFDANAPAGLVRRSAYRTLPQSNPAFPDQVARLVKTACEDSPGGGYNSVGTSYAWLNANTLTMLGAEQFALDGRQCNWAGITFSAGDPDGWQAFSQQQSRYLVTVDYGNSSNRLPAQLDPTLDLGSAALRRHINGGNVALLRRAIRSGSYVVVPGSRRFGLVLLRRARTN